MAATKSQGSSFGLFMVGVTVAAGGIAGIATGMGKLALLAGIVLLVIACVWFFKIKPEEGKPALSVQPIVLRLAGLGAALLGWIVVLVGLHVAPSVSGRMVAAIVGLAISLVGVIGLLPAAARQNAIWKA
jgi:hypothetical protein